MDDENGKYGEPWDVLERIEGANTIRPWCAYSRYSEMVYASTPFEDSREYIDRVVNCVNALEGIANPGAVKDVIAAARQLLMRMFINQKSHDVEVFFDDFRLLDDALARLDGAE